jgi:S-adenosylmethionine:tRNA ribosyltransferase-isomerase
MNAGSEVGREGSDGLRILDDYDFSLPAKNISQRPTERREASRLMVLDRETGAVIESGREHRVSALPGWLRRGDLLVINVTRVLPARLVGRKASGGGAEALLLGVEPEVEGSTGGPHGVADEDYRALVKCRGRLRVGLEFEFGAAPSLSASIVAIHERGEVTLRFAAGADPYSVGLAPLPPYIKRNNAASSDADTTNDAERAGPSGRSEAAEDLERYQTVYARAPGAIAAPTAGLHLTESLLEALRAQGVEIAEVVLHVGAGTFRPLDEEAFTRGRLHAERFELPEETVSAIDRARARGGRVVAVGTTTTRVLESRATEDGGLEPGSGETDLFIRPGSAPFRVVDALLTNFHLPRSSLLLLVAAFVGRDALLAAYEKAIADGFRFYSYGDAMLIMPGAQARSLSTEDYCRAEGSIHAEGSRPAEGSIPAEGSRPAEGSIPAEGSHV